MITKKEYNYVVNVVFFKESPYIAYQNQTEMCFQILKDCVDSILDYLQENKTYSKREILNVYKLKYDMKLHANNKAFCIMLSYIVKNYNFEVKVERKLGEKVSRIYMII